MNCLNCDHWQAHHQGFCEACYDEISAAARGSRSPERQTPTDPTPSGSVGNLSPTPPGEAPAGTYTVGALDVPAVEQ